DRLAPPRGGHRAPAVDHRGHRRGRRTHGPRPLRGQRSGPEPQPRQDPPLLRSGMGCVWVLRHGESTANVEGVIVSAPGPRALVEVGLTPRGREQAREAARAALEQGLGPGTVLIASDFARARETAEEFATGLGAEPPRIDQRLRERGFGALEEGPASAYDGV